jgi:hypothetical protein
LVSLGFAMTVASMLVFVVGAERNRCIAADVPWPIVMPNGERLDGGTLRICYDRELNPATGLHEIQVGGVTRGLFASRIGKSEESLLSDPVVVFARDGSGRYRMLGYALSNGSSMDTFVFYDMRNREAAHVAREQHLLEHDSDRLAFLASNLE